MIRSVEFSETADNPTKIDLVRPNPSGFIIRDIKGIGAGKADLHSSKRASMDGDVHNGARLGDRNIVFSLGYGRNLDPEDGRDMSYDVFPLKERVRMTFTTDNKTVEVRGYIESNVSSIFTREPEFDVSIMCAPYFKSADSARSLFRLYSLEDKFEFEFSNESLTENKLIMGEYDLTGYGELRYNGSVPTGVLLRMMFTGTATNPSITNDRTQQTVRIDTTKLTQVTGRALSAGDVIEVSTVRGSRSVTLIRDGKSINILTALAKTSKWIEIKKGMNPISVNADTGFMQMQTEIEFDTYYSGL